MKGLFIVYPCVTYHQVAWAIGRSFEYHEPIFGAVTSRFYCRCGRQRTMSAASSYEQVGRSNTPTLSTNRIVGTDVYFGRFRIHLHNPEVDGSD